MPSDSDPRPIVQITRAPGPYQRRRVDSDDQADRIADRRDLEHADPDLAEHRGCE